MYGFVFYAHRQGLTYANGVLYESAGLYGKSTVRILDPDTADVKKSVDMDPTLFAEGMAYINDELVQITWKSRRGFVYDPETLEIKREFKFSSTKNEGWGITLDECRNQIVMTDGSNNLHIWDPRTLQQIKTVPVMRQNNKPARELNEIEYWRDRILANVWYEDVLLVIHPETGKVEKEYGK
jgi:glutaminyl-peptide cyclotransferase